MASGLGPLRGSSKDVGDVDGEGGLPTAQRASPPSITSSNKPVAVAEINTAVEWLGARAVSLTFTAFAKVDKGTKAGWVGVKGRTGATDWA